LSVVTYVSVISLSVTYVFWLLAKRCILKKKLLLTAVCEESLDTKIHGHNIRFRRTLNILSNHYLSALNQFIYMTLLYCFVGWFVFSVYFVSMSVLYA